MVRWAYCTAAAPVRYMMPSRLRSTASPVTASWYQCGFAYAVALMINQFGGLFTGNANIIGVIAAVIVLAAIIYMLVRPYKEATKLTTKVEM